DTLAVAYTDALNRLFSLADDEPVSGQRTAANESRESEQSEVSARARARASGGAKPAERV
ncbi:MAG TPA: hypothetical protein VGL62_07250, partial [Vicinamibacterales bacterium]